MPTFRALTGPLLSSFGTFLLLVLASHQVSAQPYTVYSSPPAGVSIHHVEGSGMPVQYARSGNPNNLGVLFIHGTPGSWHAFGRYLTNPELQDEYLMVALDRPGWGSSRPLAADGKPDKKMEKRRELIRFGPQSQAIQLIMNQYPDTHWLLVGHSLGASIAPRVALESPEQVRGLLLLAGSLAPNLGKARWYNRAANFFLINWLLPRDLRYSNDEIMVLRNELTQLEQDIAEQGLRMPTLIMQGMKDKLVSPRNTAYARAQWSATVQNLEIIELEDAGHFLPWKHAPEVVKAIKAFD